MGLFKNLFKSKEEKEKAIKMELGLKNNSSYSFLSLKELINRKNKVDEAFLNELEEILITSDMGIDYTFKFMDSLRKNIKKNRIESVDELKELIFDNFYSMYLNKDKTPLNVNENGLSVYLFMGVNGSGKTTSIAKLAYQLNKDGKKVLIAAGDTFRAGAVSQLETWGERLGIKVISKEDSVDPSSVIFDALKYAKENAYDFLLCDTAGRLQNKVNLMKELEKIYRVIGREVNGAPHEAFIVIDSTTGQNGLSQASVFNESCALTGIILTKLDGTSKGGIALSINNSLGLPIKYYGYGEKETDFSIFNIEGYLYALLNKVLFEE